MCAASPSMGEIQVMGAFELDPDTFQIRRRVFATRATWVQSENTWALTGDGYATSRAGKFHSTLRSRCNHFLKFPSRRVISGVKFASRIR